MHTDENIPKTSSNIRFYDQPVPAGFPSPVEDPVENGLDFNQYLVKRPSSTFVVSVSGDSMQGAGIFDGDLAIVDRSLTATHSNIVIAVINGEMMIKRFMKEGKRIYLKAENVSYSDFEVQEKHEFDIWGVVTYVIHKTCA